MLTLDNRGIRELVVQGKEIQLKMYVHEKTDSASETTPKCRKKRRATAANKQVAAFNAELVEARKAHVRLVDVAAQSETVTKEVSEEV